MDRPAPAGDAVLHARVGRSGRDGELTISSIGDSRAYWVDSDDTRQLTVDESWAQEQIEQGE